jgi:nitronate monooxygenase
MIGYVVYDAYSAHEADKEVLVNKTRPSSLGLHTPICDLLGVRYPLIQAPMAGEWPTPELVSAVCEAGGFGVLAGARITPEKLREDIRAVKARTNNPSG